MADSKPFRFEDFWYYCRLGKRPNIPKIINCCAEHPCQHLARKPRSTRDERESRAARKLARRERRKRVRQES